MLLLCLVGKDNLFRIRDDFKYCQSLLLLFFQLWRNWSKSVETAKIVFLFCFVDLAFLY